MERELPASRQDPATDKEKWEEKKVEGAKPKAEVKGIRAATEICPTQTVRRGLSRL